LKGDGIETLIHYPIPPHQQACYREWKHRSFPVTEKIHAQELSIPMNQAISAEEAKEIVAALNSFR
jgi:dTDP-4-amino-4,6-dideoxygalactose transaminase